MTPTKNLWFYDKKSASVRQPLILEINSVVVEVAGSNSVEALIFSSFSFFFPPCKAPFIWRKVVPGKRVSLLAESTLASVYMTKKLIPLPEPRVENRARACSE